MKFLAFAELQRLWSIRVAIFWSAVGALVLVLPLVFDKLTEFFDWRLTGGVLFLAAMSFGVARALKQPGAED